MWNMDISQIIYNYVFVIGGVGLVVWGIFKFGVHKAVDPILERLTRIEYQVNNNGGESMKDAIDRIETDVVELKINQAVIKSKLEC